MGGQHEHQRPEHGVRHEELRSHLLLSEMDVPPKESKVAIKHWMGSCKSELWPIIPPVCCVIGLG